MKKLEGVPEYEIEVGDRFKDRRGSIYKVTKIKKGNPIYLVFQRKNLEQSITYEEIVIGFVLQNLRFNQWKFLP